MSVSNQRFRKDPSARIDYVIDWAGWMTAGDAITASSWAIEAIAGDAAPLTEALNTFDDDSTAIWVTGGTLGNTYTVTNHITTSAGRQDERSIFIEVKNR